LAPPAAVLAIFDKGVIQTTISLPISGNKITETIMNTLKLDWQQAEKAKVVCGLDKDKCSGALSEILNDNFEELAQKIRQSVQFYYDHYPNPNQIKQIIICGCSANFSEIDKNITEKSGISTIVGDPWTNVAFDQQKNLLPPTQSLTLTTAIGLALRGINLENV
jgi:Tfp pilus assembly PilM family ATPase